MRRAHTFLRELFPASLVKASLELPVSFGKLWNLVDAFKINQGVLHLLSSHPALSWEVGVRKRELLKALKTHGIKDISVRREG